MNTTEYRPTARLAAETNLIGWKRASLPKGNIRALLIGPLLLAAATPASASPILTGLSAWYEGDAGYNGTSWQDESGNGHTATVIGTAPGTTQINGYQALVFTGAQSLSISGEVITDPQNYTIIAVETDLSGSTGYREIFSNWSSATGGSSVFLGDTGQNPDRARFTDYIGGANDANGHVQQGVGTITNPSSPSILSGISSSVDALIYQNTTLLYDAGSPIPARTLNTPYYIGVQGSLGSEYWKGDIAELLVYNHALSQTDFNTDVSYLSAKWLGTPEPGTPVLFAGGTAVVFWLRRRRAAFSRP